MSIAPFIIVFVVLFVGLILVLKYVMGKSMTDATEHLQSMSADYSRRQEELKRQLNEVERNYQERMARARTEAEQLVSEARQEVETYRTKRLEDARIESERVMQQALESRDGLRKELEQEIEVRSIKKACEIIDQSLPEDVRRSIQNHWFDEIVNNGSKQLDKLKAEDVEVSKVEIVSALALDANQKQKIESQLKIRFGEKIEIIEELDDRLVAGLTIKVGSIVLDASLASKIRQNIQQPDESL